MIKLELICLQCGQTFLRYPSQARPPQGKYCSRTCSVTATSRLQDYGPKDSQWGNNRIAHRTIALKERGNICERCGAAEKVEVHHRDRNRAHFETENLEVLCPDCHHKEHAIRPSKKIEKACPHCAKSFQAWPHEADSRIYCSRKCAHSNPEFKVLISERQKMRWSQRKATVTGMEKVREDMTKVSHSRPFFNQLPT